MRASRWLILAGILIGISFPASNAGGLTARRLAAEENQAVATTRSQYAPGPLLLLAIAEFRERRGEYDEARRGYERVLAAQPKSVKAITG
ncbi:MAG TPA: tetratricopeptide repeat protein, partial [Planctomycetaceae bacterium]|nr:tetratricopeptide repeat protein [Planctomycetaceae bacterium]